MSNPLNIQNYVLDINRFCYAGVKTLKETIKDGFQIRRKSGSFDLITDADIKVQKTIISEIRNIYPKHQIISEELDEKTEHEDFCWIIDPVDGTSAFSIQLPTYAISIALAYKKNIIAGAIYTSVLDKIIYAGLGLGTYIKSKRQHVSIVSRLEDATVAFDPSYYNRNKFVKKTIAAFADNVKIFPMIFSTASAMALVAVGVFDAFVENIGPKIWDVAAGKLLIEESGGLIGSTLGGDLDIYNTQSFYCSNIKLFALIGKKLKDNTDIEL
jgi:myo-inositol-1(or 4)-monophosphatase